MIANIIKDVYGSENEQAIRELLDQPIVCGCLFRSFDDFTQHLIFLMYANQGTISRKELLSSIQGSAYKDEGRTQLSTAVANLTSIRVISRSSFDDDRISLNEAFEKRLNSFIVNPVKTFGEPNEGSQQSFFNLLYLLNNHNQILSACQIGSMSSQPHLSRANFDFIRLPIGYKISILIKGYLKSKKNLHERRITLKNILLLSEMNCHNKYKITKDNRDLINQLHQIRLVRRLDKDFFAISPYLHNFAFEEKKNTKLLDCSIIIQTNFKVYAQIPRGNSGNYKLIKSILKHLIRIEHQDYELQELIVGDITQDIVRSLFVQNISVQDYFSFFLEYMTADLKIEKDLGKWNKIKFLGLQGPQQEMMIPNNVKQELKLWETVIKSSNPTFTLQENNPFSRDYYQQSDS